MNYLIYCGPGIGDFILVLPMVRRIKHVAPKSFVTVLITSDQRRVKASRELFELQNEIDSLEYYSLKEKIHFIPLIFRLFTRKYDYGFCLQYTDNITTSKWPSRIINFLCKKTCGIKHTYHKNIKYDYEIRRKEGTHIVDYTMDMLDCINIKGCNVNYEYLLNQDQLDAVFLSMQLNFSKIISLVVGTAEVCGYLKKQFVRNDVKNWSQNNWQQLSVKLSEQGYSVILLGGNKEKERFSHITFPEKVINLLGKCSIKQSISIVNKSELVIGADTGLMHCSGVLKIPSLTLFGCTDSREYLPFGKNSYFLKSNRKCSPCFGSELALTCKNKECMSEITVQQVYTKALTILKAQKQ